MNDTVLSTPCSCTYSRWLRAVEPLLHIHVSIEMLQKIRILQKTQKYVKCNCIFASDYVEYAVYVVLGTLFLCK